MVHARKQRAPEIAALNGLEICMGVVDFCKGGELHILGGAVGAVAQNKAAHLIGDRIAWAAVKPDFGQTHEVLPKGFQTHGLKPIANGLPVGSFSVKAPIYPQIHDGVDTGAALGVVLGQVRYHVEVEILWGHGVNTLGPLL
ncbi:hypothetical protein SDC9_194781 [bioreactor metagenome]|uniref:Uncharacterized protein n=1 Tax=bioreactor metagenome TaxID=1076179 RepID=A0A645I7S9_9ZZZZ